MSSHRFSTRWLFALIGLCALVAAGLSNPSIFWGAFFFSLAILIVSIGLLGTIFTRDEQRAYWIGFVMFGAGYLFLMYCPGFDRVVGQRLISTKILGLVEIGLPATPSDKILKGYFNESPREAATNVGSEAMMTSSAGNYLPQWGHFQEVGHSAIAVALALFGGRMARYFYASNASLSSASKSADNSSADSV